VVSSPNSREDDEIWMNAALLQAAKANDLGEVPVGAVIVQAGEQIGCGFNQAIHQHDATAHAEVVAIRDAAQRVENYRLPQTTLYVTLEPCMMCVGAMVHARIGRLVFGAFEPKSGAVVSHSLLGSGWLNHKIEVTPGILAERCGGMLSDFFAARRAPS
jgi:tRNA(adenine34) deaminase